MWKKLFDRHFWIGVGSIFDLFGTDSFELPTSSHEEDAEKLRQDWEKVVRW